MPTKKTPQRIKQMVELHQAGSSNHAIAEAIGVDVSTVGAWLRGRGLPANGKGGRPRRPVLARNGGEDAPAVDRGPVDPSEPVEVLQARLATLTGICDRLAPAVEQDQFPAQQYAGLVKLEGELAARVAELTPPPPPDPEKDPTNAIAAAEVRTRLERLVARAEQSARCVHCGQPPFARVAVA